MGRHILRNLAPVLLAEPNYYVSSIDREKMQNGTSNESIMDHEKNKTLIHQLALSLVMNCKLCQLSKSSLSDLLAIQTNEEDEGDGDNEVEENYEDWELMNELRCFVGEAFVSCRRR